MAAVAACACQHPSSACLLIAANDTHSPSSCWPAHPVSWLAALFASPRLAHVRPIAQVPRGLSSAPPTAHGKVICRRHSLELMPRPPFPARSLTACWRIFVLSGRCMCSRAAAEGAAGGGDAGGVGMARVVASAASSAAAGQREARLRACSRARCGIGLMVIGDLTPSRSVLYPDASAGASRSLDFNGECRQVYPDSQGRTARTTRPSTPIPRPAAARPTATPRSSWPP